MSTISAGTTTTTGLVQSSDTTGALVLQTGASSTTALTLSSAQNATFANAVNLPNTFGFKNRIINGGMTIDQRNAGASVTITTDQQYTLDRWNCPMTQASKFSVQQNAGSVTPPTGFINYLGVTSLSSYSVASGDVFDVAQNIEGLNVADLSWGTANAKTVTLSFQVYSSLTGTFGGVLRNSAGNRSYPFAYTISSANTWTSISITIAGDTTGTWLTTNGIGIRVLFGLGCGSTYSGTAGSWSANTYYSSTGAVSVVGTNGATWYVTGVQLEVGSQATSFDFRSIGTELALCQRYFEISYTTGVKPGTVTNVGLSQSQSVPTGYPTYGGFPVQVCFMVTKRTTPTMVTYSNNSGASGNVYTTNPAGDAATSPFVYTSANGYSGYSGANIVNAGGFIQWQWTASAEL